MDTADMTMVSAAQRAEHCRCPRCAGAGVIAFGLLACQWFGHGGNGRGDDCADGANCELEQPQPRRRPTKWSGRVK